MDSGSNTNITPDKRSLQQFRYMQSIPLTGIDSIGPVYNLTDEGYFNFNMLTLR